MLNPDVAIVPQPMQALTLANERRKATAELKQQLRRREITLAEVLADPPAAAGHVLAFEVLLWAPHFGRWRLRALNMRAVRDGHVNLAAPLGALTVRQRQWLAREVRR